MLLRLDDGDETTQNYIQSTEGEELLRSLSYFFWDAIVNDEMLSK